MGAIICNPTGRPLSVNPVGTDIEGQAVKEGGFRRFLSKLAGNEGG